MRFLFSTGVATLLLAGGCKPPPTAYERVMKQYMGDQGELAAATPSDCNAMILVARERYHYGAGATPPRLGGTTFYQACAWAENGIVFPPQTPDNKYDYVGFSAVKTVKDGFEIQAFRVHNGDGTLVTDCQIAPWGGGWRILTCREEPPIPLQILQE